MHKFRISVSVLVVVIAISFYFVEAGVAQFHEQQLIPLSVDFDANSTDSDLTQPTEKRGVRLGSGRSSLSGGLDERFVVYGRTSDPTEAGIASYAVNYRYIPYADSGEQLPPDRKRLPDLESFFDFGGTLELLTTMDANLSKYDIVISEVLWGIDTGITDTTSLVDHDRNPGTPDITIAHLSTQESQWIELYNTTDENIDIVYDESVSGSDTKLYLLFTPFVSYPNRDIADFDGEVYKVLDAVSNLYLGRWELPGKGGSRSTIAFVSAYRDIDYDDVEDFSLNGGVRMRGIPFGSHANSWKATSSAGSRNILLRDINPGGVVRLLYIATPGARHVPDVFIRPLPPTAALANGIVINEVRNDTSSGNMDWIELKNVSQHVFDLEKWEISIVTGVGEDTDLVDFPEYMFRPGEILLVVNAHPYVTDLAMGINIGDIEDQRGGLRHKFLVSEGLDLPSNKRFVLLLRNADDKNGKDEAIQDYAGNGFFSDNLTTGFWPRQGQPTPIDVADFGDSTFASFDRAWVRVRYQTNDGHHKDAWKIVQAEGGLGYAVGVDLNYAPGTPGYENTAVKTRIDDNNIRTPVTESTYTDGDISISEIMYDPGPNRNRAQWIELYNSSRTQAVNLEGWEMEIQNLLDENGGYVSGSFEFGDAVILPNQTLLIVSENAATDLPENRIYDLYRRHRRELRLTRRSDLLLSPTAFYLKLTDTVDPELQGDDIVVDEVGNLGIVGGRRSKLWELPRVNPKRRRSIVRRYGPNFRHTQDRLNTGPWTPNRGMIREGWRQFFTRGMSLSFYGVRSDLSGPGYRLGGPLPVVLSSFRPVRMETGEVVISWRTASELNNAGFNILRSEYSDRDFSVVNVKGLIPGRGTSSEMHAYSYTDTTAARHVIYYYRIEDVSFEGMRETLATVRLKGDISASGKLTTRWGDLKGEK